MEGSGVVGPLVWCLYFGKFYSSALTMLFFGWWNVWHASPIFPRFLCNIQCIPIWRLCGLLRRPQGFLFIPVFGLFSVFCQFLHILAWMMFFSLSISAADPWSSTVMASMLLLLWLQTRPSWTDLSLNSVSCRRLHMRRSNPRDRDGDHKISPYRCCFLCWVRSTFEICGVALPTAAADSCWRHWKTPLCSCTQHDQVWTSC